MFINIRPFLPGDQAAARQLILAGLGEHFGWIDDTCNPDLDDITANYIEAGHVFVVAEAEGELIGAGALMTESQTSGRLVRMSVSRQHRRKGVGRALLEYLRTVAAQKGFTQVRVSTEPDWADAIGFYRQNGFTEVGRDEGSVYFSFTL